MERGRGGLGRTVEEPVGDVPEVIFAIDEIVRLVSALVVCRIEKISDAVRLLNNVVTAEAILAKALTCQASRACLTRAGRARQDAVSQSSRAGRQENQSMIS